jgi:hypothetical protein
MNCRKVMSKSNWKKTSLLLASWKSLTKGAGSVSRSGSIIKYTDPRIRIRTKKSRIWNTALITETFPHISYTAQHANEGKSYSIQSWVNFPCIWGNMDPVQQSLTWRKVSSYFYKAYSNIPDISTLRWIRNNSLENSHITSVLLLAV